MQQKKSNTCLKDLFGRSARYLRLSITDRCNLSCLYCSDISRQNFIPHDKILRYEQFLKLAAIAQKFGIAKIRITGGEPFVRKGSMDFLKKLRLQFPQTRLAITSNATLIEPFIADLASLGLDSINISLDSFRPESFKQVTGHNLHSTVIGNIEKLLSAGQKVKLNAVLLKGITNLEADDFVHAIRDMPIDMRFIEFMPMGSRTLWRKENFLSSREMHAELAKRIELEPISREDHEQLAGPARLYRAKGAKGRIGFISALSNHFCGECNRLRITSDGKLRTCLFSDNECDLANVLNSENSDTEVENILIKATLEKPLGEEILRKRQNMAVAEKDMSGIGG